MKRTFTGGLASLFFIGTYSVSLWLLAPAVLNADESSEVSSEPVEIPTLSNIIREILVKGLPETYVDDRKWGETVNRFDGVKIRGARISKRTRRVNHGFWQRYTASLIEPEKTLEFSLTEQEPLEDGRIPTEIRLVMKARCEATMAWWNYGVKGVNGTAVSDATVGIRIVVFTSPKIHFSLSSPIPRLELKPEVADVELSLMDLDVHRLGIFDGKVVEALGDGSRRAIEELLQRQEKKIKSRLQKKLAKLDEPAEKKAEASNLKSTEMSP